MKVISAQLAGDEGFQRRLREELAQVSQAPTGVQETVAVDPSADPPWLASPYVAGASLAEAVRVHGPLPSDTVQVLGAGLAEALAALHGAGLVHAVLQPHKVLLAADGPRLTPFAAARAVVAADPSRTVSAADGRFLSPEQAQGRHAGPESDVFTLAGLLVFAATGHPPFRDGPGAEALRSIVEDPPDLSGVPETLHGLLAAALVKEPQGRLTAERMLHELASAETSVWLPPPLAAQAATPARSNWSRRRVLLLAIGGAGVLAAVGTATRLLLTSSGNSASRSPLGGRVNGSPVPVAAGLKPTQALDLGQTDFSSNIAYSPDGKLLAVTLQDRVTLWDAESLRRLTDLTVDNLLGTSAVAYGRGGLLALGYNRKFTSLTDFASDLGGITVWDASGSQPRQIAQLESPTEGKQMQGMMAVAISPDGRLVAGARNAKNAIGKVQVWDIRSGTKQADLLVGEGKGNRTSACRSLAFSPDGTLLAAGWGVELEGGVTLFRTDSWKLDVDLPLADTDAFGVTKLAFTSDGLALAGAWGGLALWDVPGRKLVTRTTAGQNQTLAVSPDGRTVALGGGTAADGGTVALYDLHTMQLKVTVPSGRGGAADLAFRPDGRALAGSVTTTKLLTAVQLWTVE